MTRSIRVVLPTHLKNLARVGSEVSLDVDEPVTADAILDSLETRFPMLRGTIRDHDTHKRRAFVRYYACQEDISHDPTDRPVPSDVIDGREPFLIVGAMAGG